MARNWLCWIQRSGFEHYVLLAEDRNSYELFLSLGVPVITVPNAPYIKAAADYGSTEFQDTMTFRTNFLSTVLQAGFHFITADLDGVWLDNPLPYLQDQFDLQGQTHKEVKMSGGLIIVRATQYGKYFWALVVKCQAANAEYLATHPVGSYEPSKYTEQYCINELSRSLADTQPKFTKHLLDANLFPDGRSFFQLAQPQLSATPPVIIHNNWLVGMRNKMERLREWGLLAWEDSAQQCIRDKVVLPAPVQQKFVLRIRVLTYTRHASLKRLLSSLLPAQYHGDTVHLDVSVDFPPHDASAEDISAWQQCIELSRNVQWPHGEYKLYLQKVNIGLVGQWTSGWKAEENADPAASLEIQMFLEDDISVTPFYYTWLRQAIKQYYLTPGQYDPALFGFSLQQQHTILGETLTRKYGQKKPVELLDKSQLFYKYQLLGSWGTIMFPHHWRQFQQWLQTQQFNPLTGQSPSMTPCVPTLLSNKWWAKNPKKVWTQWFIRFAYEHGYYSLYTNFPEQRSLVINHRESGLNFAETRGSMNDPVSEWRDEYVQFPPSHALPIYDFHFRPTTAHSLQYRSHLTPVYHFDQCYTVDKYKQEFSRRQHEVQEEDKRAKEEQRQKKEKEDKHNKETQQLLQPKTPELTTHISKLQQHQQFITTLSHTITPLQIFDGTSSIVQQHLHMLGQIDLLLQLFPASYSYCTIYDTYYGRNAHYISKRLQLHHQNVQVTASDISDETLKTAKQEKIIDQFQILNPGQLPTTSQFDILFTENLLEKVDQPYTVISELLKFATHGMVMIEVLDEHEEQKHSKFNWKSLSALKQQRQQHPTTTPPKQHHSHLFRITLPELLKLCDQSDYPFLAVRSFETVDKQSMMVIVMLREVVDKEIEKKMIEGGFVIVAP